MGLHINFRSPSPEICIIFCEDGKMHAGNKCKLEPDALHDRYLGIFNTAAHGILLIDAETERIADVNPFLTKMLDCTATELVGKSLKETTPFRNAKLAWRSLSGLSEESLYSEVLTVETGSGRGIPVEIVGSVCRIGGERLINCCIRDITGDKELERQKSDFLAMVTHDFKSPLIAIIGYTELMEDDYSADTNLLEIASLMKRSGQKLLGMVDDFLFHVKLGSETLSPNFSPVNLNELLTDLGNEFAVQARSKLQNIVIETCDELPTMLLDKKLIARALYNLAQNAVNYTPTGGDITVRAERVTADGRAFAAVSVSDTGHGIPRELIPRLFEKYYRSAGSKYVRGAGLGLTIVKAAVEAHSGKVEVDCPTGGGSTFRILLPLGLTP